MSQTYTVIDNRPSGERVLATGLTWAEVSVYMPPAGVWALTARAEDVPCAVHGIRRCTICLPRP